MDFSNPQTTYLNRKLSLLDPAAIIAALGHAPRLPRFGARVSTPDGEGVFVGAADELAHETCEVVDTLATVILDGGGRRFFKLNDVREAK